MTIIEECRVSHSFNSFGTRPTCYSTSHSEQSRTMTFTDTLFQHTKYNLINTTYKMYRLKSSFSTIDWSRLSTCLAVMVTFFLRAGGS